MRSFVKIKSSRNGEINLSFTDKGKSCKSRNLNVANMSFNAIRENKILAKISGFTVTSGLVARNPVVEAQTIIRRGTLLNSYACLF